MMDAKIHKHNAQILKKKKSDFLTKNAYPKRDGSQTQFTNAKIFEQKRRIKRWNWMNQAEKHEREKSPSSGKNASVKELIKKWHSD